MLFSGTVQTVKAEQSLDSLKKMSAPEAKVLRNGQFVKIPSAEITVGDLVSLEAGDFVPADGRIVENAGLKVDDECAYRRKPGSGQGQQGY